MPHDHHDHSHEGLSPSGHPYRADNDTGLSYWQVMEIALRELLIEKGHLTAAQIHAQINAMDSRSPLMARESWPGLGWILNSRQPCLTMQERPVAPWDLTLARCI